MRYQERKMLSIGAKAIATFTIAGGLLGVVFGLGDRRDAREEAIDAMCKIKPVTVTVQTDDRVDDYFAGEQGVPLSMRGVYREAAWRMTRANGYTGIRRVGGEYFMLVGKKAVFPDLDGNGVAVTDQADIPGAMQARSIDDLLGNGQGLFAKGMEHYKACQYPEAVEAFRQISMDIVDSDLYDSPWAKGKAELVAAQIVANMWQARCYMDAGCDITGTTVKADRSANRERAADIYEGCITLKTTLESQRKRSIAVPYEWNGYQVANRSFMEECLEESRK